MIGGVDGPHAGRVVGQIERIDLSKTTEKIKTKLASRVVCQGPFEKPLKLNLVDEQQSGEERFFVTSVEKYDSVRFSIDKTRISCEYIEEKDERSPIIYSYKLD